MSRLLQCLLAAVLLVLPGLASAQMVVNGRTVPASLAAELTNRFNVPADGSFWYDPGSGMIGDWSRPPATQIAAGINALGAPPAEASGAQTALLINGRKITFFELHALEFTYILLVDGEYRMGPDLRMQKSYPGAPFFDYGQAMKAYNAYLLEEAQWCAMARDTVQRRGQGSTVLLPNRSGGFAVQVLMDANGCIVAEAQGYFYSRCC